MSKTIFFFILVICSLQLCAQPFLPQQKVAILKDKKIDEASGMAPSHIKSNCFWIHNDSGDEARIFLVNTKGETLQTVYIDEKVRDCEDIASGIGYYKGNYIYLGDIGDNRGERSGIDIYIFNEAELNRLPSIALAKNYKKRTLLYEDGARDAECMMLDPIDSCLYVVTKREEHVRIYRASLQDVFLRETILLQNVAELPYTFITAGAISNDGKEVIIKNYASIYYWKRRGKEPLYRCMQQPPQLIPYKREYQGEAVAFAADNSGFYTTTEGKDAPLLFFKRK